MTDHEEHHGSDSDHSCVSSEDSSSRSNTPDTRDAEQAPKLRHLSQKGATRSSTPTLFHRVKHDKSILTLTISDCRLYAGTQGGEILTWSLDTYERIAAVNAHDGSVLCLQLSQDQTLLVSGAGDRIVNIWSPITLDRLYSISSTYAVGDIFCVVYSSTLQTVYFGAQNTSIQWYDLKDKDNRPGPKPKSDASHRSHRFFDSKGPGGTSNPWPTSPGRATLAQGGQLLEADKQEIVQYAHYGYVYCMILAQGGTIGGGFEDDVLITGGGDGTIKLWSLDADNHGAIEEITAFENGDNSVLSIALDSAFLFAGLLEGDINVWDLDTRQLVRSIRADKTDILTLSVGDGFVFSGGASGLAQWEVHNDLVLASALAFHNQRRILVTGGNDNCVAVWDVTDCASEPKRSLKSGNEQLLESLACFVSYQTVSSNPKYAGDCRRGATYLRSLFKSFGAYTEMLKTEDQRNPIVLAKFKGNPATAKTRKKILFYGHYDVIAAENVTNDWIIDPFAMEGINGYVYGRGVSDNKGPVLAALYAVAELVTEQALDSDVVFLIEGEEESGSRGFEDAVRKHKGLIGHIDWILLANSYWLDDEVPCLTYGFRGVIHATVTVESDNPDLHSGVDGSSLLDESVKDLIMLLGTLSGSHGHVRIPGFYDPIPPITQAEEERYTAITDTLIRRNPVLGDAKDLKISLMRRWREASLTIHRLKVSGPENSTVIPRMAQACLSIRLVPNQETHRVRQDLISYLQSNFKKMDSKNHLSISFNHEADPWLGDPDNEIFRTLERAIIDVWGPVAERPRRQSIPVPGAQSPLRRLGHGHYLASSKSGPTTSSTLTKGADQNDQAKSALSLALTNGKAHSQKPLYIREGGSIPIIRFLEKEFDAPAAHFPCGQASDSAHLDNERIRLSNLYNSREIFKRLFQELPRK